MSGRSVIKDSSCILKEVDGDKFTGGIVFRLNIEVLRGLRLDLFIDTRVVRTQIHSVLLHRRILSTLTISLSFSSRNLDNQNISKILVK